jgi:hypothetical protein
MLLEERRKSSFAAIFLVGLFTLSIIVGAILSMPLAKAVKITSQNW